MSDVWINIWLGLGTFAVAMLIILGFAWLATYLEHKL